MGIKAKILRIDEPDFGCEGREEEVVVLDRVTLKNMDTGQEIITRAEDGWLYQQDINEGDCVEVAEDTLKILYKK
ncbi:MAG: hypothetical protein K2M46_03285 [Lachnospiraceae bacterium]|nr:hypothetical protein [Lachnospiraceae bacterium]